jgi:molybdate-binding protein
MTRYLEISAALAAQVRARQLEPGDEVPAVRVLAAQQGVTPSTAARAYAHLERAGVLSGEPRRRTRVAREGYIAALRLLHGEQVFRLAGSDDPALQIVVGAVPRGVTLTADRGSFAALRALVAGEADGAAIHLRHHDGGYNAPFARALLADRDPHLIPLWRREQGLVVHAGNPHAVAGPGDCMGLRVARREQGAGTRVLGDQLLRGAGVDPDAVHGPEFRSHLEIALAVAAGIADVGFAVRGVAQQLQLEFVSLEWEPYDLVLPGEALGAVEPFLIALRDRGVRAAVAALPGYDLAEQVEPQRLEVGSAQQATAVSVGRPASTQS